MATYICTACGWEGERRKKLRGSKMLSNILWWVFLIPGPFYSIWRHSGVQKECPHCSMPTLAKITSDAGQLAQRRFDMELGVAAKRKPLSPPKVAAPKDPTASFGNDRPQEAPPPRKKPVDPDQW